MMYGPYGHPYWMHSFGWGLWLLLLIVLFLVFWNRERHVHRPDSALDILKKRFAQGEIDEAEFLARKKTLEGK